MLSELESDISSTPQSTLHEGNSVSVDLATIAATLKKTNEMIAQMSKRMDNVDEKICDIEAKLKDQPSGSPGSTPSRSRKKAVPVEVRVNAPVQSLIS